MKIIIVSIAAIFVLGCFGDESIRAEKINNSGIEYLGKGNMIKARNAFIEASLFKYILDSNRTIYLQNAAVAYDNSGITDSAKYYFVKATMLNPPDFYNYLFNMASASMASKEAGNALSGFKKAYQKDSTQLSVKIAFPNCILATSI